MAVLPPESPTWDASRALFNPENAAFSVQFPKRAKSVQGLFKQHYAVRQVIGLILKQKPEVSEKIKMSHAPLGQ